MLRPIPGSRPHVICPTCKSEAKQKSAGWVVARLIRGTAEMLQRKYVCKGKSPHEFCQYELSDEVMLLVTREQMRVAEFCNATQRMFMMFREITDEALGKAPSDDKKWESGK